MNQIIQENLNSKAGIENNFKNNYNHFEFHNKIANNKNKKNKFHIEFSNEIAEIPYGGNFKISMHPNRKVKFQLIKNFISKRKYQLQFIISSIIAVIFLIFLFWKLYQNQQQEKIAQELLNNYQLTTLYSNYEQYNTNKTSSTITVENPFVIGMIKIDKMNLNYPILSETSDDLLKISICRFSGPMPNEIGNLCIAGHNYEDNRFFSNLKELDIGDTIEVYGITGQMKEYHVFQKYEVEANDLSCTNQDVGNNIILTLLTCDNSSNNKRIVVQAK